MYDEELDEWREVMQEILQEYALILRYLYFDCLTLVDGNFQGFKKRQIEITEEIIDKIHDKYADHVEAYRKSS